MKAAAERDRMTTADLSTLLSKRRVRAFGFLTSNVIIMH